MERGIALGTAMTPQLDGRREELLKEISDSEKYHRFRTSFDTSLHQSLVVLAAVGGFVALAAGLLWPAKAWIAGIIGAVPSLATVLALRLHCVKAANWHNRKANEMESLRYRLQFEGGDVALVSKDLREINTRLVTEWEAATAEPELRDSSVKSSTSLEQAR